MPNKTRTSKRKTTRVPTINESYFATENYSDVARRAYSLIDKNFGENQARMFAAEILFTDTMGKIDKADLARLARSYGVRLMVAQEKPLLEPGDVVIDLRPSMKRLYVVESYISEHYTMRGFTGALSVERLHSIVRPEDDSTVFSLEESNQLIRAGLHKRVASLATMIENEIGLEVDVDGDAFDLEQLIDD